MEFVSLEEIIASAKMQLGIDHNNLDNYFRVFAVEAEKEILSRQTISDFHVQKLKVNDSALELPVNFYSLIELIGYQSGSDEGIIPDYLKSSFYKCEKESPNLKFDTENLTEDGRTYPYYGYTRNAFGQGKTDFLQDYHPFTFQLQRGVIYFSDDCDFEYVDLAYKGFNVDENGDLLIPENHQRAIRNYIAWHYKLEDNYATQGQVQVYRQEWARAKTDVRGKDALQFSHKEQRYAEKILKSLLPARRILQ